MRYIATCFVITAIATVFVPVSLHANELALVLTNQKITGPTSSQLGQALTAALAQRGIQAMGVAEVSQQLGESAAKDIAACHTITCLAEFAGGMGQAWLWIATSKDHDGTQMLQVLKVTGGAGQVLASAMVPWPANSTQYAANMTQALTAAIDGHASMAKLDPPSNDLRGRVQFLAQRMAKAYARHHGEMGIRRLAVMDFDTIGDESQTKHLGAVVAETLLTDLSNIGGVTVVERSKLNDIVGELKLQKTGDIDPKTATEIGKFVGAGSMVVGSVAEAGSQYVINARQVSVETATVIQAESVNVDRSELVALSDDMVEIKTPGGAALRSALIPGWGQIYNNDTGVGLVFMGAGAAVAIAGGTFGGLWLINGNKYKENTAATVTNRETANRYGMLANIMAGVYGVIWLGNIVHAYATGTDATLINQPETTTSVGVAAMPTPAGDGLMVSASFTNE